KGDTGDQGIQGIQGIQGPAGDSGALFNGTPSPLGTAAAGSGTTAAKGDHVHAMPSAADVGAAPTVHTHDDRYFTETEVTTALGGKSDTGHTHTGVYQPAGSYAAAAHSHLIADVPVAASGVSDA